MPEAVDEAVAVAAAESMDTPPYETRSRISVSARTRAPVAARSGAPADDDDEVVEEVEDAIQAV